MRAAMTTSNLAATQLFKTNRKQRQDQEEETLPTFVASGHHNRNLQRHGSWKLANAEAQHGHDQHDHGQSNHVGLMHFTKRLRAAKLGDLAKEEICLESMRKLFRMLDEDGGGTVDAVELKKGMELLGFEEVADPVALDRLVREIDEDKTGTIEENEFLAYFSHESRGSLKQKLKSWCLNHVHISVTRYHSTGKPEVQVADISAGDVEKWVKELMAEPENKFNYWLDITGYDRAVFSTLAEAFGFNHDSLAELLVGKAPECSVVHGAHGPGASFIVPSAKLSLNPVPWHAGMSMMSLLPSPLRKILGIVFGDNSAGVPDYLMNRRLASKAEVADITISLEQAAVFVARQNVVLTLRNPIDNYDSAELASVASTATVSRNGPVWKPYGATLKRSTTASVIETAWGEGGAGRKPNAISPTASPFASENSTVRLQFDWLRRKLAEQCPSTQLAANSNVKILAVLLVDQLLSSNHVIRDRVQDWEELLEGCIRQVEHCATTHLEALGGLIDRFIDHLEPLATMLSPAGWEPQAADGEGGAEEEQSASADNRDPGPKEVDSGGANLKRNLKQRRGALGRHAPAIVVAPVTGVAGPSPDEEVPAPRKRESRDAGSLPGTPLSAAATGTARRSPGPTGGSRNQVAPSPVGPSHHSTGTPLGSARKADARLHSHHASDGPERQSDGPGTGTPPGRSSYSLNPLRPLPVRATAQSWLGGNCDRFLEADGHVAALNLSNMNAAGASARPGTPRTVVAVEGPGIGSTLHGAGPGSCRAASGSDSPGPPRRLSLAVPVGLQRGADQTRLPVFDSELEAGWRVGSEGCGDSRPVESESEARATVQVGDAEVTLKDFFCGQLQDFEELATDMSCLVEGSRARHDRVDNLARRLNNAKQDMINRTLYALTLVTAIATPVTICTGIYGMNFQDMPELDPTLPGSAGYGYSFFWKVIATVVSTMLFILFRLGLFKTLL